jgi:hypothetical protein
MPFVSEAQRRKCYVIQRQMNELGLVSKWDCKEFGKKTSPKKVARKSSKKVKKSPRVSTKRVKSSTKRVNGVKSGEQVFIGARGGKYVIRKNKKVYV